MNELSEVQREKLVTDLKNVIQDAEELLKASAVSYTHLRAHETPEHLVCRLMLEKKN